MKKKYLYIGGGILVTTFLGITIYKYISKKRNINKGIEAPTGGQSIIEKKVYTGSEGFVNVRTSAKIDNMNVLSFDFSDNILGKSTSSPVGKILKQIKGADGYYWYEIELTTPIEGKTTGFVREDAVIVK